MFSICSFLSFFWGGVFFKATPSAYGSCQARGQIEAAADGLRQSHSNEGSELHLGLTPRWILNPLSKARDQTCVLMDASQIHFCCATMGTPVCSAFVLFFTFLGLYPRHVEVPSLGVESELQLLAYTTAAAMRDLSRICDLHHSSRKCRIPNPLSEARD